MLAGESRIDSRKIKTGMLSSSEFSSFIRAAETLYEAPFYIVAAPNMRLQDIRTQARRLKTHEKVEIIFIDYMTLVTPENTKLQTFDQYSEVSKSLKNLARELDIPIVVLSQLGRGTKGDDPKLSDIRASGGIEQDADLVIFLIRKKGAHEAKLRIEKQRNGETGDVNIAFLSQYMKFENLSREK
jgi:replicative DNA helicase